MTNLYRGEIEAVLDGKPLTLCLTLGALAELEQAFGEEDMLAVAERFEAGRITARDAIRVLGAGLRGAGHEIDDRSVAAMRAEGGAAGFVAIVANLLTATFGSGEATSDLADENAVPADGGAVPAGPAADPPTPRPSRRRRARP